MKTYNIPRVEEGPATLQNLNAPIQAIQSVVNQLSSKIDTIANKSAIIQWQAPVDLSQVSVGDLVYFDSDNSLFRPAVAALLSDPGEQGQSIEAPSSRVQGLIISLKTSDNSAVLLRNGYYEDPVIEATLGNAASAGQYFLSPTNPGKAVKDPGWNMRQPCISYYGDGKFSLCTNYIAHDNHHHGAMTLNDWQLIQDYTGSDFPSGTKYFHRILKQDNIGQLSSKTSAIFYEGKLNTSNFQFSPQYVWFNGESIPVLNSVVLFNNYPFAYGDSVIRSVQSSNFDVKNYNGNVYLQMPDYQYTQDISQKAISKLYKNQATVTPIVSKLIQGAGISIDNLGKGRYQLNSTRFNNVPIPADDMYLNGVQRVASGLLVYSTFPAEKQTYFIMSSNIFQGVKEGSKLKVNVWVNSCGPGADTLDVKLYWLPLSSTEVTPVPSQSNFIAETSLNITNMSTSQIQYTQSSDEITIDAVSSGILIAKVLASSPSYDIRIFQAGFKYSVNNGDVSDESSSTPIVDSLKLDEVVTYNAVY